MTDWVETCSIKQYGVVCMTAATVSEQRRVAALCRKHGTKFISADVHGFFAIMWLDLLEHESVPPSRSNQVTSVFPRVGALPR